MALKSYPEFIFGNRLSPLPKARVNAFRLDDEPPKKQFQSWDTEDIRKLKKAVRNIVVIPDYSLAAHQAKADSEGPPKPNDSPWRTGETITVDATEPTIICDSHGTVAVMIIPDYVHASSRTILDHCTEDLMRHELAPNPKRATASVATRSSARLRSWKASTAPRSQKPAARKASKPAHVRQRNIGDKHNTATGVHGDIHLAIAWHPTGHQRSDGFAPSLDTLKFRTIAELSRRFRFCGARGFYDRRLNHLIHWAYLELSNLMISARPGIDEHPLSCTLRRIWDSNFFGHAILCNRQSGEHLDKSGVRRGWDVILAAGEFNGGEMFFKDIRFIVSFRPGTLLAFDGTAQRHVILPFTGQQRISHVFFLHQSVFDELGIDTSLPDLNIQTMRERLGVSTPISTPDSPLGKRKRSESEDFGPQATGSSTTPSNSTPSPTKPKKKPVRRGGRRSQRVRATKLAPSPME
ncbi:hypothetical protein FRC07_012646 [Ceratobasidium sp. 392]|nr:hypothetical protein FRC07_012646 [Ceratobasidium sp. 392]